MELTHNGIKGRHPVIMSLKPYEISAKQELRLSAALGAVAVEVEESSKVRMSFRCSVRSANFNSLARYGIIP